MFNRNLLAKLESISNSNNSRYLLYGERVISYETKGAEGKL